MATAYASGATLREIGCQYSLSHERVRQLLRDADYDISALKAEAERTRRRQLTRQHGGAIRQMLAAGQTPGQVAATLGIPVELVKRLDSRDPAYARARKLGRSKATPMKYTDEEVLRCLRKANESLGGVLTTAVYTRFAHGRHFGDGRPWPTHQTAHLRFGSWRSALERAGLPANPSTPITGHLLFTDGHCIDAILEVERVIGHLPSVAEYERYAAEMAGVLPSSATIRKRLGGWQQALKTATDFAAQSES